MARVKRRGFRWREEGLNVAIAVLSEVAVHLTGIGLDPNVALRLVAIVLIVNSGLRAMAKEVVVPPPAGANDAGRA